jgi:prepilin-type N-terminal cleavage/methylation domain-containing protein
MAVSRKVKRQQGFTLIEAMISMVILAFGVLSLAAVYSQGLFYAQLGQMDYIASKKAEEAVETIFTARDTGLLTWAQIQNVSGVTGTDGGVFLDGPQPLLDPGPDGLVGTADDEVTNLNPEMTRQIQIVPVPNESNLRQITITIRFQVGRMQRTYTLISYVSAFA